MKFDTFRITPETLLTPDDPIRFINHPDDAELGYISFNIELRPIEFITTIRMIGRSNVKILNYWVSTDTKEIGENPFPTEPKISLIDMASYSSEHGFTATAVPFGSRIYRCRLFFSGVNLIRLLGTSYSDICYKKDGETILDVDKIILGRFIPKLYSDIVAMMLNDVRVAIPDDSPYAGIVFKYNQYTVGNSGPIQPVSIVALRYLVTSFGTIDCWKDKPELSKKLQELKSSIHSSSNPYMKLRAIFVAAFPVAYIPMTMYELPNFMQIIAIDNLTLRKRESRASIEMNPDAVPDAVDELISEVNWKREDSMARAVISVDMEKLDVTGEYDYSKHPHRTGDLSVIYNTLNTASILRDAYGIRRITNG